MAPGADAAGEAAGNQNYQLGCDWREWSREVGRVVPGRAHGADRAPRSKAAAVDSRRRAALEIAPHRLHTYGLLRDSFRLAQEMESVRTIWRLRDRHVKEAGRSVQHMQKALTKMNIQLANVLSDINGLSGQEIIGAILQGERDPWKLADLKHYRVKASREEVARSLEGNWRDDVLFELGQAVDGYRFSHWPDAGMRPEA